MRQQLIKGIGGRLFVEFPSRPSAVSVTIKRSNGADLQGGAVDAAAATLDPFYLLQDQDVDDAGDVNGRSIIGTLQNTTTPDLDCPVEIRRPDDGLQFNTLSIWRWISEDDAQIVASFRQPLRFDPPAPQGTSIRSLRAWYTIAAESCALIEENFRAVFTATINGQPVVREVIFDVGLRDNANPALVHDILSEWPDLQYSEAAEWTHEDGFQAVQGGWHDLQIKIRAKRLNPNRIRDVAPLKTLIVNRAMRRLAITGCVPPAWVAAVPEFLQFLDDDFKTKFADVLAGLQWYDNDDFGTSGAGAADGGVNLNRIRLSR
jgi:hypothetical protein